MFATHKTQSRENGVRSDVGIWILFCYSLEGKLTYPYILESENNFTFFPGKAVRFGSYEYNKFYWVKINSSVIPVIVPTIMTLNTPVLLYSL